MNNEKETPKTKSRRERTNTVLANRVSNVLNSLDVVSKCANKQSYDFDEKDIQSMESAIASAVQTTISTFKKALSAPVAAKREKPEFKF